MKKRRRGMGRERMQMALILCVTPLPRTLPPFWLRTLNTWSPEKSPVGEAVGVEPG